MMIWWVAVATDGIIRGANPFREHASMQVLIVCAHAQPITFVVTP